MISSAREYLDQSTNTKNVVFVLYSQSDFDVFEEKLDRLLLGILSSNFKNIL